MPPVALLRLQMLLRDGLGAYFGWSLFLVGVLIAILFRFGANWFYFVFFFYVLAMEKIIDFH